MKYAKNALVVTWSGGMAPMRAGATFEDDHPLVVERPDLFTDEEPGAQFATPTRVESGLQRPGESRMERGAPKVVAAPPRKPNGGA
jgi:hypothetical protein